MRTYPHLIVRRIVELYVPGGVPMTEVVKQIRIEFPRESAGLTARTALRIRRTLLARTQRRVTSKEVSQMAFMFVLPYSIK